MRIAQVAPLQVSVPPAGYGGTERVVSELSEALVKRGHDVTLFASADSHTSAQLVPMIERAMNFEPGIDATAVHLAMLEEVYDQADRFDIIHSHLDYLTLPFAYHATTPTVITLHGKLTAPDTQRVYRRFRDANYISISNDQRSGMPDLHYVTTIHHGVDVDSFPFAAEPGAYLTFVGRMSPQKRPDIAIEIAKRVGIPLKIAAKVDHAEEPYFREVIQPLLDDPLIEWLGQVGEHAKRELMAHALALLLPIDWPEPFGMVYIESLACGTPVLTCPRGAAIELLENDVTGYSSTSIDALVAATQTINRISRAGCRAYAKRRFDVQQMASQYVRAYEQVIGSEQREALWRAMPDADYVSPDAIPQVNP